MEADCFACGTGAPDLAHEAAHRWVVPRTACRAHREACELEPGVPLWPVLQGEWPGDLDGAGANLLLNPVRVDGRRAWLDVTTRGRAVLEEVFASGDYFEFAALHLPTFVEVLYTLRDHVHFAHREPLGVLAALGVDNARYTSLQALLALWSTTRALQDLMRRAGRARPDSLEEAAEVWREARQRLALADPQPDHLRLFLMALMPLAGRRFAHLGGAPA